MSREIKFRAWDTSEKKMYACAGFMSGEVIIIQEDGKVQGKKDEGFILMQLTGLLDKNGREIYEGDTVIWSGGQYTVTFSEVEGSWILKDDRDDWECPSLYGVRSPMQSRIEVIGNIYEQPNLPEK